jgi:hypothetical protein
MKVASAANADEVSVRLCFLVKVLKASGLNVAGGSKMGNIVEGLNWGGAMGLARRGRIGCAGVPKAGEEDGIGFVWPSLVAGIGFAMVYVEYEEGV